MLAPACSPAWSATEPSWGSARFVFVSVIQAMSPTAKTSGCPSIERSGPATTRLPFSKLEAEIVGDRAGLEARAPDERVRVQDGSGLERHARRRDGFDDLAQDDVDPARLQRLLRVRLDVLLEHRQERGPALDQGDPRLLLRHARIVGGEIARVELGQGAGALDARRPAPDDDHVQRAVGDERRILVGRLPPAQHVLLEAHSVGERVHREGVLRRALGAEEVDPRSEPEDEVVVVERRHLGEVHPASRQVDSGDRVLVDGDVGVLVEEVAQRVPHLGGLQQVGRELVEERLERVVVVLVDEDDIGVGVLQRPGRADAAEAAAEDDDTRPLRLGAVWARQGLPRVPPSAPGRRDSRSRLPGADRSRIIPSG